MQIAMLYEQIATLNTTIAEWLSALTPTETVTVSGAADEPTAGSTPHVAGAAPLTFDQAIILLDTMR
jgi:hypothetical protein